MSPHAPEVPLTPLATPKDPFTIHTHLSVKEGDIVIRCRVHPLVAEELLPNAANARPYEPEAVLLKLFVASALATGAVDMMPPDSEVRGMYKPAVDELAYQIKVAMYQ